MDRNDRDLDIDYVSESSETDDSEPSFSSEEGIYKGNLPYVLELHDIKKDDPLSPAAPLTELEPLIGPAVTKLKKHRKKKRASDVVPQDKRGGSLSSMSDDSSVPPSPTDIQEEFYDAHESYHAMPENSIIPAVAQMAIGSDTNQDTKAPDLTASFEPQSTTPAAYKEPTPIIKPTSPP